MVKLSRLLALVGVVALSTQVRVWSLQEIPQEYRIGGFALGCQAYTFHRFTVFEAIEKTAASGGRLIEFFPGQKVSPDDPTPFDHHCSDAVIEKVKAKLNQHHVMAVNYGVVGLPNKEEESRKVFEFAKKLGLRAVTSEPQPEAIDLIEKLVKEFDIAMAIHNHPKQANNPNYKFWDPKYILSLVDGRDKRLGSCADLGHFARSGIKPADALKTLEGRVISSHLKDIKPFGPRGADVPYGTGESDVISILDELNRQKFQGNISVEYESNLQNNVPDVAQCIGFVRGYGASRQK
jgi:sugar phosphate isomerase/epimerase